MRRAASPARRDGQGNSRMRCLWMLAGISMVVVTAASARTRRRSPTGIGRDAVADAAVHAALLDQYCITCHNQRLSDRGTVPIELETADLGDVSGEAALWEKVIRKLRTGSMPPAGRPRPDQAGRRRIRLVAGGRDRPRGGGAPHPGRTEPLHRLNRTEYQNAIRDLLALDVDAAALVPADDQSLRVRQHRRRAEGLADPARTLHARGARDQPPGRRRVADGAGRRDVPRRLGPVAVPAPRRAAIRHARRHVGGLQLPARRRVRHRDRAPRPVRRRADPGAAPAGGQRRRRARGGLPPDAARPGAGSGRGLQSRAGGAPGSGAGRRRPARGDGGVHQEDRCAGGEPPAAVRPAARRRRLSAVPAARRHADYLWPVQRDRRRRDARPPPHLHLPAVERRGRRAVRPADPRHAGAPRVPAAR